MLKLKKKERKVPTPPENYYYYIFFLGSFIFLFFSGSYSTHKAILHTLKFEKHVVQKEVLSCNTLRWNMYGISRSTLLNFPRPPLAPIL